MKIRCVGVVVVMLVFLCVSRVSVGLIPHLGNVFFVCIYIIYFMNSS